MRLATRHAAVSHVGRQRAGNEDTFVARSPLFAVADGMGGARAGEVAARIAVDTLAERLAAVPARPDAAAAQLAAAAAEANARIFAAAAHDRSQTGMGTTLTALLLCGHAGLVAHIGDSRAYLLRGGQLRQLTEDHSLVAEMVRDGRLAAGEARLHPYRSVLSRALGTEPEAEVDQLRVSLEAGDVVLLCSDGLCGPVSDERLRKALAASDPHKATRRLVDEALRHGGPDNITAVVVQLYETDQPPAERNVAGGATPPAGAEPRDEPPAGQAQRDPPRRRWHWLLPTGPGQGILR